MPTVMISPEAMIGIQGPWVPMFEKAGFTMLHPPNAAFSRGLCSQEETIQLLSTSDAVIAGGEFFTPDVIAALPKLKVIARAGVGYDRVDVPAATKHGIPVTITPTANHQSVAESTFALLFAIAKGIVPNDAAVRSGRWRIDVTEPVRGKTLGLVGLGRIGRSTAKLARAIGMTILAAETYPDREFVRQYDIELVSFDALLSRSDYVSIHCPLNADTQGLFNRNVFAKMKPGSVLINTARGGLVVEADLVDALKSGHLSAAGLDVFEEEPAKADNPLFRLDNVVLSPHVGGIDRLSMENMAIESADCIIKLSRNQWPTGAVVNDELRSNWKWA